MLEPREQRSLLSQLDVDGPESLFRLGDAVLILALLAELRRLVAIYEAMKPEEAARIFETMDGTVLLDVVTRMGERRLAPVLAQMTPARAQALTVAMANRRIAVAQPGS
jgi:flagellar motility protein MotE (MotC chaperone)